MLKMLSEQGKKLLEKEFLEEQFLKKDFPLAASELTPEEKFSFDNLLKRKRILKKESKKIRKVFLTKLGKEVVKKGVSGKNYADRLTHEMLEKGSWKNKKFRAYDVSINVHKVFFPLFLTMKIFICYYLLLTAGFIRILENLSAKGLLLDVLFLCPND